MRKPHDAASVITGAVTEFKKKNESTQVENSGSKTGQQICSRFKVDRGFSHVKEGGPSGLGSGQRKGGGPVNVLPQ